jgi:hypothetical protein
VDRNFTSQASHPFVLRTPGCRNAEISWTGTSQVKRPIPSSFEPPVAEMPKCPSTYSFGFLRFVKSECKGYLCSLESPVAEMPKCPSAYSFRFSRVSRNLGARDISAPWNPRVAEMPKCPSAYSFGFSRFVKSGCKGYLCSLESPVVEMPKCRNEMSKCLGVRSTTHNNPWDLRSTSDLAISLFRDSGFWETRISVLPTRDTRNREMDQRSRSI